ncbi:MAG: phosphatase PAP2 family protein, partial [Hypericibacter sp.]
PGLLASFRRNAVDYGSEFLRELPAAFRLDAWLILVITAFTIVGAWVAVHLESGSILSIGLYFDVYSFILPITLFLLFTGRALYIALIMRPKRPLLVLMQDLRHNIALPRRLARGLPMLLFLPFLIGTFSVTKAAIPFFHPFSWDVRLERWDRWLHGGTAPWELLQPLLGHPFISLLFNVSYNVWFFALWFTCIWQFFTLRRPQCRMQFLLSMTLSWILIGGVLAAVFSSAGPCYFARVVPGPDPYAPLMNYLYQANDIFELWSLNTQELLWEGYSLHRLDLGTGISAMPSMHVAVATLLMLLGWRTSRAMGIAFTVFLGPIMVGSVHLGWHYALDGYVSVICALLLWAATGWFVRHVMRLPNEAST